MISFVAFHERGLALPPRRALHGLLNYYGIELHHLNPNGIQHLMAFFTLCEGFLGIEPHFDLWRYFFAINLLRLKGEDSQPERDSPLGCAGIHLRNNRSFENIPLKLVSSNKEWRSKCFFFLKNRPEAPFLACSGNGILTTPVQWKADVPTGDREKIADHLAAISVLRGSGLKGAGVIGAYHASGVAPLMRCALLLFVMTPDTPRAGSGLAAEPPPTDEVARHIKSGTPPPPSSPCPTTLRCDRTSDPFNW